MANMIEHIPVLYQEVLYYLQPYPGGKYIDGTIGAAGHTSGLLEASAPDGRVLGLDRDPEAIAFCRKRLADAGERVTLVQASFAEMDRVAQLNGFTAADGILIDLGLSSRQLASAERGFSFRLDGPLDMRFDTTSGVTAGELLNTLDESTLSKMLRSYGEVRQSRRVARAIVEARPIRTTKQLADLVARLNTKEGRHKASRRIHPATRVFQALRIAVNEELAALKKALPTAVNLLRPGGRLAAISFHSLEDRMVKQFIREQSRDCVCPPELPICNCDTRPILRPVTKRVIKPTDEEVARNPRSRSARLRVAERLTEGD
ncbi:MAG: 16S rRNA (cytosine(1402)-N(4))-methyltransferase RsmH [Chloroflexota bacterium]|nr:MAG: 16S rRNA (cytosine(1402)-N(4))-methyltransferase RsmH [Chloroflexota bacterium]